MIKLILASSAVSLMLTACAQVEGEEEPGQDYPNTHFTFEQELPDGGSVLCVWAKNGYGGGLSCDWEHRTMGEPQ